MEAHEVNALLYREIKPGKEFEKLIPAYLQIDMNFEKNNTLSDTYDTLQFMANWTVKYRQQFEKLAQRLKGKNVLETVQNNYSFLYNHFQYRIDESTLDQTLYTLSGAWHFRKHGFDCKTFSLLASGLLLAQGIPHSFRKVKIDSNDWAHVYVVVPINKNQYTIIDATTKDNKEVRFIEKHDFDMTKYLKHRGIASPIAINALACPSTPSCGCKSSLGNHTMSIAYNGLDDMYGDAVYTTAKAALNSSASDPLNIFGNLNLSNISFGSLCTDRNSSFTTARFDDNVAKIFNYFFAIIDQYNNAIASKNFTRVGEIVAEFEGKSYAMFHAFMSNRGRNNWNPCTDDKIVKSIRFVQYKIYGVLLDALKAHYNNFFAIQQTNRSYTFPQSKVVSDSFDGLVLAHITTGGDIVNIAVPITNPTPKTNEIKQFIVTQELKNVLEEDYKNVKANPYNLNVGSFIQQLVSQAPTIVNLVSGNTNSGSSNNFTPGDDIYVNPSGGNSNGSDTGGGMSTTTKVIGGTLLAFGAWRLYNAFN